MGRGRSRSPAAAAGRNPPREGAEPAPPSLALDIGTRKVLGVLFRPAEGGIEVVASARREHEGRAMRDGQIHDVEAVSAVIRAVKADLEARVGRPLREAMVAAAGRALRTAPGEAERAYGGYTRIGADEALKLEWEAVAEAQAALQARLPVEESAAGYYCVGHSVTGWRLDGAPLASLVDQQGRRAAVSVLATFLPRTVVDSLDAALEAAGLDMAGMTLEPIAALEAVVPPTMRHLNLALVDVGAGTADIALTRDGTVWAYAMVPEAGDEVTEAASRAFLLDFGAAETAKRRAGSGRPARVRDVLGAGREITPAELREAVAPVVAEVARAIAAPIRELNQGAPEAVLLVGGGSLTPGLRESLAEALGLSQARVAVRDRGAIRKVKGGAELRGPDVVTPLGIALLSAGTRRSPLIRVQVEDRWVRLFQAGRCTVREALRAAGIPVYRVLGRPGVGFTVTVNGEMQVLLGRRGRPGGVNVNGAPAELDRTVADRDAITVIPAEEPVPPDVPVAQFVPALTPLVLQVDGEETRVDALILVNGAPPAPGQRVQDRDEIEVRPCRTLGDVARALGRDAPETADRVHVTVNGTRRAVDLPRWRVTVNGAEATSATPVRAGDRLRWERRGLSIAQVLTTAAVSVPGAVRVTANGRPLDLQPPLTLRLNGRPAGPADPVSAGDHVQVAVPEAWQPQLNEVLPRLQPAPAPEAPGGRLVLKVNGRPAAYTSPLKTGDTVEVRWEHGPAEWALTDLS